MIPLQLILCLLLASVTCVVSFHCLENDPNVCCKNQVGPLIDPPLSACSVDKSCVEAEVPSDPPLRQLESVDETEFNFALNLFPKNDDSYPLGLNLTLETNNTEITKFFFSVQQNGTGKPYHYCRMFDLTGLKDLHPTLKTNLYYDCLCGLDLGWREFVVGIRATPINQEVKYKMYVPTSQEANTSHICEWSPLALLNLAALSNKKVDIMFTPMNPSQALDEYSVLVTCGDKQQMKSVQGTLPRGKKMLGATLRNIPVGKCTLAVVPIRGQASCPPRVLFKFHTDPDVPSFNWYYLIMAFLIMLILVAILLYVVKNHKVSVLSRPRVLLLYSEDCPAHMEVVLKLYDYLRTCCSLEPILDCMDMKSGTTQDPLAWVIDAVQDAEYIILIVSEGVRYKIEHENQPRLREISPYTDRLLLAYRCLISRLSGAKPPHLFQVIFSSYCQESLVPRGLRGQGHTYLLMKDMNRLLCHIHRGSLGRFLCWQVLPGGQYMSHPEGETLSIAIEKMRSIRDANPQWFQERLGGN